MFKSTIETLKDEERKREDLEKKNIVLREKVLYAPTEFEKPSYMLSQKSGVTLDTTSHEAGYKDRMISQLIIDNRKLKEELSVVNY